MSLPMKGLVKVKADLAEVGRKFKMFSVRCDYGVVKDVGSHNRVACCSHEEYDVTNNPHCLCLLNCCPVIQG